MRTLIKYEFLSAQLYICHTTNNKCTQHITVDREHLGDYKRTEKKLHQHFFLFEKKKYIYLHTIKELRQSNINTIFASDKESSQNEQKKKLKKNEERKE